MMSNKGKKGSKLRKSGKSPILKKKRRKIVQELAAPKEEFFKRVLQYVATQIFQLSTSLMLPEKVQEDIWQTFKYILIASPDMFIERYLDQVLLCCF